MDSRPEWMDMYEALVDEVALGYKGEEFNKRIETVLRDAETKLSEEELKRLKRYISRVRS